jgi:energy-coupling factor transporter ATP-binding protein EcfA2
MTNASVQIKKSPLHEILDWSANRPEWQRDALRRVVEKGEIDNADIVELERISRARLKADAVKPVPMAAVPLSAAHLPPSPGAAQSVSLLSISDLRNVNRLPAGANLPFGDGIGLTVVYGENGAGKSSYARVIKKACRARGSPPIIVPNAFVSSAATKPASAVITFRLGGSDIPASWTNGVVSDSRLANVFVFDSFSADHYVSTDSTAAFTPHGLDVLPTLSKVCDVLAERLKTDMGHQQNEINRVRVNWKYDINTEVGKFLQKLSSLTADAQISAIASMDQKQTQRLHDLREALKADPLQKSKETRAAIARLESFVKKIAGVTVDLTQEKTEQIKKRLEDAKATESDAKAFAAGQFDSTFLTGTGSDLWQSLWDAACEYSKAEAYPNVAFPAVTDGANCVLCQQELDDDAVNRLSRFDAFCKNVSLQLSENAEKLLQVAWSSLSLLFPLVPELEKVDADLSSLTPDQRLQLSEFVTKADARLQGLKQSIADRAWTALTDFSASPESMLKDVVKNLDGRAKTEESAHDPETRKKLSQELRELEAREWLFSIKADVLGQVTRHKIIAELEGCKKDLSTAPVTSKGTELTKQFVTDAFQKCFVNELQNLGLRTLQVTIEPIEGKKGETKFGLRLVSAGNSKVAEIASEGEQRCIALAAFLSELSQASHQSALVFDDPVSSLDHWHRERIAGRLVVEAKHRQVIVFTHDVVFLNDLLAFAERAAIVPNVLTLEWNEGAPGRYIEGLPWDSKKPLECLTELEKTQKIIADKWNPQPNGENIEAMRHTYSRLRSTLERIVEVELLDGIVCRFESQVNAGRVRSLIGVTAEECDEAKRLLNKCHQITDAHAPSTAAIPDPAELTQDIADARKLITDIRHRKKQNKNPVAAP